MASIFLDLNLNSISFYEEQQKILFMPIYQQLLEICHHIIIVCKNITGDILSNVQYSLRNRLQKCFEVIFLNKIKLVVSKTYVYRLYVHYEESDSPRRRLANLK